MVGAVIEGVKLKALTKVLVGKVPKLVESTELGLQKRTGRRTVRTWCHSHEPHRICGSFHDFIPEFVRHLAQIAIRNKLEGTLLLEDQEARTYDDERALGRTFLCYDYVAHSQLGSSLHMIKHVQHKSRFGKRRKVPNFLARRNCGSRSYVGSWSTVSRSVAGSEVFHFEIFMSAQSSWSVAKFHSSWVQ